MSHREGLGSRPLLSMEGEIKHFGNGLNMLQLWANVCIIETGDGIVLFDAGFEHYGPRLVEEIRKISDKPVRFIIYGHGHADHAFGTRFVIEDAEKRGLSKPVIIAHENLPKRFDRYRQMLPYHEHINRIQFAIPEALPGFVRNYVYPDFTYNEAVTFKIGEVTFELHHAKGETDDTTWLWIPEKKTVCVSDLWVWSCPNVGNPFKVQRYEKEWAHALETIAGKGAEILLPGHGPAMLGAEKIREACAIVARAMRYLHEEVVRMLNEGKWQEEILNSFKWPDEFANSEYLQPIYGHPYFVVQAILRRYHGWYDGNPSHIFPSSSKAVANEITALAGGAAKLLDRARSLEASGATQLALHLADMVIDSADASQTEAYELKINLLKSMADKERSLIARNIFIGGVRQIKKILKEK